MGEPRQNDEAPGIAIAIREKLLDLFLFDHTKPIFPNGRLDTLRLCFATCVSSAPGEIANHGVISPSREGLSAMRYC